MAPRVSDDTILDAVADTIVSHGYAGATTLQIAEAAGVNEATLFRRFGSKPRLVLAAVQREVDRLNGPEMRATGDLRADLVQVLEYFVRIYRDRPLLPMTVLLDAARAPELASLIQAPAALQLGVRRLMAAYQDRGELVRETPQQAANALVGPLIAFGMDLQMGIAQPSDAPSPQALLERFLAGHKTAHGEDMAEQASG
jgi:AcrR family transcriptional regulator